MDLIELFIGLKKGQLEKTELLGDKSGKCLIVTSAIGTITKNKVSEYKFTETAINTKACGVVISVMDKVPTGKIKEIISYDENTLEIGMKE